jgi:hypothetical protein
VDDTFPLFETDLSLLKILSHLTKKFLLGFTNDEASSCDAPPDRSGEHSLESIHVVVTLIYAVSKV